MVWREDMPTLILDLLQKQTADALRWHFNWSGRLTPCASPRSEDIEEIDDVSSILYLGSLRTHVDALHSQVADITAEGEKWASYFSKGFPQWTDPHKAPGVTHFSPAWYAEPLVPRLQPRLRFPRLEFKTTVWRRRRVAVYSLPDMLGEERTRELVRESKHPGERCLVMKRGRHNVPVEILLMRMQAYVAEPGP
jgi:hypothetical protein